MSLNSFLLYQPLEVFYESRERVRVMVVINRVYYVIYLYIRYFANMFLWPPMQIVILLFLYIVNSWLRTTIFLDISAMLNLLAFKSSIIDLISKLFNFWDLRRTSFWIGKRILFRTSLALLSQSTIGLHFSAIFCQFYQCFQKQILIYYFYFFNVSAFDDFLCDPKYFQPLRLKFIRITFFSFFIFLIQTTWFLEMDRYCFRLYEISFHLIGMIASLADCVSANWLSSLSSFLFRISIKSSFIVGSEQIFYYLYFYYFMKS